MEKSKLELEFESIDIQIDVSFWMKYNSLKLDKFKLSMDPVDIFATYQLPISQSLCRSISVDEYSLLNIDKKSTGGLMETKINGCLLNTNTIEEYKTIDLDVKAEELLQEKFIKILESDSWINQPNLLNTFLLVSFADLKKYIYRYNFKPCVVDESYFSVAVTKSKLLHKAYKKDTEKLKKIKEALIQNLKDESSDSSYNDSVFVLNDETDQITNLESLISDPSKHIIMFIDPSPKQPSCMIKNLLFALSTKLESDSVTKIKLISLRDKISKIGSDFEFKHSCYFEVDISKPEDLNKVKFAKGNNDSKEHNLRGIFDPNNLAQNAVGLNLKLMKWRMAPELDLEIMKHMKCLLLGSGSLGCQIARNLLSWGFENITFVDNGKVAYSNPVRQCLFTFQDSIDERNKADCAAERLKEIYPNVQTQGFTLCIPMPGHPARTEEAEKEIIDAYHQLDDLVKSHDVVFLITDSRESRWLPTVLAAVHNKICMTVALGFETFLALRQGLSSEFHDKEINGETRLGCYFCNDTVAPRNSMQDRTLDQQCTVTRPAMCSLASAISVELLVSLLNHPLRNGAIANEEAHKSDRSVLGIIPHQIRGDMNEYRITPMCGYAFDMCIACSDPILDQFKQEPTKFLLQACNTPGYLEDLSGITKKMQEINFDDIEAFDEFDIDDED